jgi:hypothetical protein
MTSLSFAPLHRLINGFGGGGGVAFSVRKECHELLAPLLEILHLRPLLIEDTQRFFRSRQNIF